MAGVIVWGGTDLGPELGLTSTLATAALNLPGRVFVITSGAAGPTDRERVMPATGPDGPAAGAWAMGRALVAEHPAFFGGVIDIPLLLDAVTVGQLAAVVSTDSTENQFVLRGGEVFVPRLQPVAPPSTGWTPSGPVLLSNAGNDRAAVAARALAGRPSAAAHRR